MLHNKGELYDTLYCKLKTMLLKYTYVSVEIIEEIIIRTGGGRGDFCS